MAFKKFSQVTFGNLYKTTKYKKLPVLETRGCSVLRNTCAVHVPTLPGCHNMYNFVILDRNLNINNS